MLGIKDLSGTSAVFLTLRWLFNDTSAGATKKNAEITLPFHIASASTMLIHSIGKVSQKGTSSMCLYSNYKAEFCS